MRADEWLSRGRSPHFLHEELPVSISPFVRFGIPRETSVTQKLRGAKACVSVPASRSFREELKGRESEPDRRDRGAHHRHQRTVGAHARALE